MSQLKKIKSIKRYSKKIVMYDLEVEGDKSYNANNVFVHNSEFCSFHDGQIIKKDDAQLSAVWCPNHYNCRSILNPIMITDTTDPNNYYYDYENNFSKWGTDIPAGATQPAKGFGGS